MSSRLERLRSILCEKQLDGAIVSNPSNRFYLSGYTADDHAADESGGVLLIDAQNAILYTSANNSEWAASEAPGFEVLPWKRPWSKTIANRIAELGWKNVGFEDNATIVATFSELQQSLNSGAELIALGSSIDGLRSVKDEVELALVQRALSLTDEVFEAIADILRPGLTEREIAWMVERTMRERGADGLAFSTSVASGPHSARPHHGVTDRTLREGEPIIIDLGARIGGYDGDLTRTLWLGEPDHKFQAIYNVVLAAHDAAMAGLRAGMSGKDGDALARDIIAAAGYGDQFVHGLGHGLGVRIHESPSLGISSTDVLKTGEVVTVEPGIYIPGWGGVRIEDVVVMTSDGCRVLTRASKMMFAA